LHIAVIYLIDIYLSTHTWASSSAFY